MIFITFLNDNFNNGFLVIINNGIFEHIKRFMRLKR